MNYWNDYSYLEELTEGELVHKIDQAEEACARAYSDSEAREADNFIAAASKILCANHPR